jgi:neutral ceramidase
MDIVERELGGTCMFLQGAAGDINPYMDKTPLDQNGLEEMRNAGEELAHEVVRVARGMTTKPCPNAAIQFREDQFDFEPRWDLERTEALQPLYEAYGKQVVDAYIGQFRDLTCTMPTAVINDELAFVGMPGEIFVDFQLGLKSRSPIKDTFLLGYCNGYLAYFPTIQAAAEGGYGAGSQTFVEVGAGERMVDRAVINLYTFAGKLEQGLPVPSSD